MPTQQSKTDATSAITYFRPLAKRACVAGRDIPDIDVSDPIEFLAQTRNGVHVGGRHAAPLHHGNLARMGGLAAGTR
jgi:hypothetical protein